MSKLRVAIVAPSLRILGGQAVHSEQLIDGRAKDAETRAIGPAGLRVRLESK